MHFIEHSYAHDWTNWWIPNRACVEAMLRSSGFAIESQPEEEVYICRWTPHEIEADYPNCIRTRPNG
jgi:tRNA (mo5U34)-methyltransferase